MKKLAAILLFTMICPAVFGQYNKKWKDLGDKAFTTRDYPGAAADYKKALGDATTRVAIPFYARLRKTGGEASPDRTYLYYRLGESYRLYENYSNAGLWYYKIIDENNTADYPLSRLWYGVCLRAGGYFDDAIKQLQQFISEYKGDEKYTGIANKELSNCRFAKQQYQNPALVTINRFKRDWNITGGSYALVMAGSNYFFTSSNLAKDIYNNLNQVYTTPSQGNNAPVLIKFNDDSKDAAYGTPSIDQTGKRMYLARWYKEGGKTTTGIYLSILNDHKWNAPVRLNNNVNTDGFSAIQPYVTADGKRLFYSSDKPGGQGGYDIWVSELDADGNPVNSINLGSTINTQFDEQAPYYDTVNKRLIYSSKGFTGLGGFDFFESFGDTGQWSVPRNMGYPMNSAKDDLYYFPDDAIPNKFYISSDRESDCCLNIFEGFIKQVNIKGSIIDCYTQQPLPGVKVTLADSSSNQTTEIINNQDGTYILKTNSRGPYTITLAKTAYFTKVDLVAGYNKLSIDTLFNSVICLQHFEVNKPIIIKNILYDFNKSTLRPESKVVLDGIVKIMTDNPKIKIELSSHTDSIGSDAYNLKLSQARAQSCVDYIIADGIDAGRIRAAGYGKTRPIQPNSLPDGRDNPNGRQLNRRTEFTVTKTE